MAGFAYLMAFTPLGRHMRFVGASREVRRLPGVRVNRIRFGSFAAAGALSGVGTVIAVAALGRYVDRRLRVITDALTMSGVLLPGGFQSSFL